LRAPCGARSIWAAPLEGYAFRPYDGAEIERLRRLGITDLDESGPA